MFGVEGGVVEWVVPVLQLVGNEWVVQVSQLMLVVGGSVVVVVAGFVTDVGVDVVDVVAVVGTGPRIFAPRISAPGCFYGSHYHQIAVCPTPGRFLVSLCTGYLYTRKGSGFSLSFPLWVYLHLSAFWVQH